MVILTKDFDGFGNQLLLSSHFIANVAEYGYELAMPAFGPSAHYFEGTARQDFGGLPIRLYARQGLLNRLQRLMRSTWGTQLVSRLPGLHRLLGFRMLEDEGPKSLDLNDPDYLAAAHKSCLLIHGWLFRDRKNFVKHGDLLRHIFRPLAVYQQAVERILAANRLGVDLLIAVHIRRGDYDDFHDGAYLFKNSTYARAMREMQALFPTSTRIRFLLFSNEDIPAEDFSEFDTGRSSDHPIEDLYAMAGCDYILGPLSTYSMWASFYGRVPLNQLHRSDQPVTSLDEFEVFEDQESVRWEQSLA